MELENIWAYGLLEEVKRDALRKMDGMKPDQKVYKELLYILKYKGKADSEAVIFP